MIALSGATVVAGSLMYVWARVRIDARPLARV